MDLEVVREQWEMQGAVPDGHAEAVAEVRRAVALVAEVAGAASLEWLAAGRAFATPVLAGTKPFRVALAPASLRLQITTADGEALAELALDGKSAADAARWLADQGAKLGKPIAVTGAGGSFALGSEGAFEDIARSYGNAVRALLCVRDMAKTEDPVRVAPAALHVVCGVAFDAGNGVGLGFAPGDAECPLPYFYAKPCPVPRYDAGSLPELEGGGEWKTEGAWFGGLLRRTEWVWYDAEQLQAGASVSFLDSCVDAARALFSA